MLLSVGRYTGSSRECRRARRSTLDVSLPKRPRHHAGELFSPLMGTVRNVTLAHQNIRTGVAQSDHPPGGVVEKEWFLRAGEEIRSRYQTRDLVRRSETPAR